MEVALRMAFCTLVGGPYAAVIAGSQETHWLIENCDAVVRRHDELTAEQRDSIRAALQACRQANRDRNRLVHEAWGTGDPARRACCRACATDTRWLAGTGRSRRSGMRLKRYPAHSMRCLPPRRGFRPRRPRQPPGSCSPRTQSRRMPNRITASPDPCCWHTTDHADDCCRTPPYRSQAHRAA